MTAKGTVNKYQARPGKRCIRWRYRLDVTTTGPRRRIGEVGYETKAEAETALTKARQLYAVVIDPTDATLGEYVDSWLEHRVIVGKIRSTTGEPVRRQPQAARR